MPVRHKAYILVGILLLAQAQMNIQADDLALTVREFLLENQNVFQTASSKDTAEFMAKQYEKIKDIKEINPDMMYILSRLLNEKYKDNNFLPLSDKKMFNIILKLCKGNAIATFSGLKSLGYFESEMYIEKSETILDWFKTNRISIDKFHYLPVELLKRPDCAALNKKAIDHIKQEAKKSSRGKLTYLFQRARLGDEDAKKILISNMKGLNPENSKDFDSYVYLVTGLLLLCDQAINVIILKEFERNIGSPDFFSYRTIRYEILKGLYRQYYNDDFFKKYQQYLIKSRKSRYDILPLDSETIGDEDKMKQFFEDFRKWAKERLNYDMNMEGIEYKIISRHRDRVTFS